MNVLILGATGSTARHLIRQSLDRGHTVTAMSRHASSLQFSHDRLRLVDGDALDLAQVADALSGQDSILFAIGETNPIKASTLVSDATRTAAQALADTGGGRIVAISVLGVGDSAGEGTPFYDIVLTHSFLRNAIADRERQEQALRDAPDSVEWVAVRAALLTDDPPRGTPTALVGGESGTLKDLPRADLASFMLDQLETDGYVRQAPALGYPAD